MFGVSRNSLLIDWVEFTCAAHPTHRLGISPTQTHAAPFGTHIFTLWNSCPSRICHLVAENRKSHTANKTPSWLLCVAHSYINLVAAMPRKQQTDVVIATRSEHEANVSPVLIILCLYVHLPPTGHHVHTGHARLRPSITRTPGVACVNSARAACCFALRIQTAPTSPSLSWRQQLCWRHRAQTPLGHKCFPWCSSPVWTEMCHTVPHL